MSSEALMNFTACVSALWIIAVAAGLMWLTFGELTWTQRWQFVKRAATKAARLLAEFFLITVMLIVAVAVVG
jgi:hypothetical protein